MLYKYNDHLGTCIHGYESVRKIANHAGLRRVKHLTEICLDLSRC